MQSLKILLAVLAIGDIAINQALADNFIKRALENLKRYQENRDLLEDRHQEQRDDDDDDDDDDNVRSVRPRDLGGLLDLALKAKDKHGPQKRVNKKETNHKNKQNYQPTYFDVLSRLGMNEIVVYDPESNTPVRTEKEKNPLLALLESSNYDKAITEDENDKSPIYVIVKSDDLQSSKSDRSINDLFSSLLKSSSSNQNDRSNARQEHRYKGFRVLDSYRRGDSNDKFSSGDDEDKRPMVISRPRTYGGGRTPIPYIRHRGDIYEKDS